MTFCSYKEFVKTTDIQVDSASFREHDFRYSMRIPFKRGGTEVALVIMMNPSKADDKQSDRTINNVLTRIHNECAFVKEVVIVNLYPIYETYSSDLTLHEQQGDLNLTKIASFIPEVSFVLLGWGKPQGFSITKLKDIQYFRYAQKVLNMLQAHNKQTYKVGDYRDGLYPKHLGRSPFATKMTEVDVEELKQAISNCV